MPFKERSLTSQRTAAVFIDPLDFVRCLIFSSLHVGMSFPDCKVMYLLVSGFVVGVCVCVCACTTFLLACKLWGRKKNHRTVGVIPVNIILGLRELGIIRLKSGTMVTIRINFPVYFFLLKFGKNIG